MSPPLEPADTASMSEHADFLVQLSRGDTIIEVREDEVRRRDHGDDEELPAGMVRRRRKESGCDICFTYFWWSWVLIVLMGAIGVMIWALRGKPGMENEG